jgi:glycopeptide antibiotics resistance protein
VSVQSGSRYLAIALACAAACLSLIGRSRIWLHTMGSLHVWYHVVLFAVLVVLAMCASGSPSKRAEWIVAIALLGFAIETSQALMNHTTMEWPDVRSDACGIVVGGVAAWLFSLWLEKTR